MIFNNAPVCYDLEATFCKTDLVLANPDKMERFACLSHFL